MKSFLIIFSFFIRTGVFPYSQKSLKKVVIQTVLVHRSKMFVYFFHTKTAFFSWFFLMLFSNCNLDGLNMMLGFCFILSCFDFRYLCGAFGRGVVDLLAFILHGSFVRGEKWEKKIISSMWQKIFEHKNFVFL